MAVDEGAQLHKRLGTTDRLIQGQADPSSLAYVPSYTWQVLFIPALAVLGRFTVLFLRRELTGGYSTALVFVAISCLVVAVGLDFAEGLESDRPWNVYTKIAECCDLASFTTSRFGHARRMNFPQQTPFPAIVGLTRPLTMALAPGTRLGPYEITALIGSGGMGEGYRARDMKLDRDVALKVVPDFFANDPERLARFKREAKVLASLNQPNSASICGLEESDDAGVLVLELVEGPTLGDRIAEGPIPVDEALPSLARWLKPSKPHMKLGSSTAT